ncbi:hypothetical protein PO909_008117, partial [Leuciscus waleckii]
SLDGNVIVRSDARVSSLTLKYVQFTDAGQYLCTARNSIGQDIQSMYLEVRYAPKIQGPVAVYTWEGNPANLTCEALAHPGASISWFRDGQMLPNANTTNVKIYNTPTISFLEVTPVSQNDFGDYNCTATNVIGTESKDFILIQAEVPSAPSIERLEPYSSTAMVEFDEPKSDGGVPILKYKAEWRIAGQDWTDREYEVEDGLNLITIVGLKPETTYEVKISAINGKGEGESSALEIFKTQPVRKCLCLSVFLSLSPSLSCSSRPHYPQCIPALDPAGSHSQEMHCLSCVYFCIYMWMCVFILVCVRVFELFPEDHCVTAASHLSSASL